ncbi:MAG: cytochrome c oxidase subunit 4, partial [Planctomycetes bacterium]|nr:cytochrome c oxidase subunit 4 [Planctomycetota bacterium]
MNYTDNNSQQKSDGTVEMPRPTAWPLVLSLGLTLSLAGIVTNYAMTVLGAVLVVSALAGWIYQLLPGVGHIHVPWVSLSERPQPIVASGIPVTPLKPGMPGHRARLPEKVHPYSAGATGGLVGGAAMAATALAYGLISGRGIWYPINLLAGMVLPSVAEHPEQFSATGLIVATLIHGLTSLGVGMFFGVLLPTLPRWPIFWG